MRPRAATTPDQWIAADNVKYTRRNESRRGADEMTALWWLPLVQAVDIIFQLTPVTATMTAVTVGNVHLTAILPTRVEPSFIRVKP